MLCPACQIELAIAERQGIEIDYCPGCRGIWLDRGELDKIVERSASPSFGDSHYPPGTPKGHRPKGSHRLDDDSDDDYFGNQKGVRGEDYSRNTSSRKKRSSWLGELFDLG